MRLSESRGEDGAVSQSTGGGEISKEEFEGNMEDLRTLTEMQSIKMKVAAKASAQRLCKGIEEVVLNGLMTLL